MISIYNHDILFNDLTILEKAFGQGFLKTSSVSANCDCNGYSEPLIDEELDTDKITEPSIKAS